MSELKLVSPLLDQMSVEEEIAGHNGCTCYALRHVQSGERFVVKRISVPASDLQDVYKRQAGRERVAQVDAEIHGAQAGHGAVVEEGAQRDHARIEDIDIVADAALLRLDLVRARARKIAVLCQTQDVYKRQAEPSYLI